MLHIYVICFSHSVFALCSIFIELPSTAQPPQITWKPDKYCHWKPKHICLDVFVHISSMPLIISHQFWVLKPVYGIWPWSSPSFHRKTIWLRQQSACLMVMWQWSNKLFRQNENDSEFIQITEIISFQVFPQRVIFIWTAKTFEFDPPIKTTGPEAVCRPFSCTLSASLSFTTYCSSGLVLWSLPLLNIRLFVHSAAGSQQVGAMDCGGKDTIFSAVPSVHWLQAELPVEKHPGNFCPLSWDVLVWMNITFTAKICHPGASQGWITVTLLVHRFGKSSCTGRSNRRLHRTCRRNVPIQRISHRNSGRCGASVLDGRGTVQSCLNSTESRQGATVERDTAEALHNWQSYSDKE